MAISDDGAFSVQNDALRKLEQALTSVSKKLSDVKEAADEAVKSVNSLNEGLVGTGAAAGNINTSAGAGGTGAAATATSGAVEGRFAHIKSQYQQIRDQRFGGSNAAAAGAGVAAAGIGIGQLVNVMDNRIDRNVAYGANIDRMNVYMQQLTGASREEMQRQRMGLLESRVDPTQMLGFEARFGISATPQMAQSIEGIRHLTGYSMGTGDVLAVQQAMMNPEVVNRMMMTTGQTMFNVGGGERDLFDVIQSTAGGLGLLGQDEEFLRGARRPGSITRTRMAYSGLPEEMQDLALDYAQAQAAFEAAGGEGMYDPRKEEHRAILGDTENNLATQMEETDRKRAMREEKMFTNQMDAYVAMEKHQQTMVDLLTRIDDTLSGLYGARARTRTLTRALSGAAKAVGGLMMFGGGVMGGIGGVLAGFGGALGDPPVDGATSGPSAPAHPTSSASSANDANITVPTYGNKQRSLEDVKKMSSFSKLHPNMQDRILRLLRANPKIGFGEGYRSYESQEKMFLDRYAPTSEQTKIHWNGTYWKHVKGAPAAPPGRSMHGIGLAVDLILNGQENWLKQNLSKFGLKDFTTVNNEPWHVQPQELPNGFSAYEKSGAPWGLGPDTGHIPQEEGISGGEVGSMEADEHSGSGGPSSGGFSGVTDYTGSSISEVLDAATSSVGATLGMGGNFNYSPGESSTAGTTTSGPGGDLGQLEIGPHGNQLTGQQVAKYAYNAGFRGENLVTAVAVAKAESNWDAKTRYKPSNSTEDSYGLMQMNMDPRWAEGNKARWGISSAEELYDPATNMRAAKIHSETGPKYWRWWTTYTGSSTRNYKNYWAESQAAVAAINTEGSTTTNAEMSAERGDPTFADHSGTSPMYPEGPKSTRSAPVKYTSNRGGNGKSPILITAAPPAAATNNVTVNVSPNVNINGMPDTPDIRKLAQQIASMMKQEVDLVMMRSS